MLIFRRMDHQSKRSRQNLDLLLWWILVENPNSGCSSAQAMRSNRVRYSRTRTGTCSEHAARIYARRRYTLRGVTKKKVPLKCGAFFLVNAAGSNPCNGYDNRGRAQVLLRFTYEERSPEDFKRKSIRQRESQDRVSQL